MRIAPIALSIGLAVAGVARAGVVSVSFADTPRFSDAGSTPTEEERTRADIARFLQSLGERYLPADQSLKVEVTDIDLAGEVKPAARLGRGLRVVKGRADWPRISMRYTLEAGGKVLKSGAENVSDLDYASRASNGYADDPLHYEKRMLEGWFRERFSDAGH